jgi:heterodisulfide reductase subunit A-like polyferredoxin
MSESKVGLIFCVCTGKCPGFSKMDIWDFINILRKNESTKYAIIHPMLCDDDGERFLAEFLKKGWKYVIAGCAPVMQKKLFRDAFAKAGLNVDTDMIPVDARNMPTEQAIDLLEKTLKEAC